MNSASRFIDKTAISNDGFEEFGIPWPSSHPIALHGGLLSFHNSSLPVGVVAGNNNSDYTDSSGYPQTWMREKALVVK